MLQRSCLQSNINVLDGTWQMFKLMIKSTAMILSKNYDPVTQNRDLGTPYGNIIAMGQFVMNDSYFFFLQKTPLRPAAMIKKNEENEDSEQATTKNQY